MTKTMLVTGADYGHTGFCIAERFAKEGYDIVLTCRSEAALTEAISKLKKLYNINVNGFILDLRCKEDACNMFDELDKRGIFVEVLCLNAADLALGEDPSLGTPFFEVTPEYLEYILQANVVGNFRLAQYAAVRMKQHRKGSIVFLSSNTAIRPNASRVPYVASKGGINSMSRGMAVDLGQYGIRCNAIMPGTIKTSRWVEMGKRQITNGAMIPIGDISDFEDIANAVYFLGSEQSKNITGTEITLDGGMTTQLYPELLNKYRAKEIEAETEEKI